MINPLAPPPTYCREEGEGCGRTCHPKGSTVTLLTVHFCCLFLPCMVHFLSPGLSFVLWGVVQENCLFLRWFLLASACHLASEFGSYVTGQMWSLITIRLFLFSFLLLPTDVCRCERALLVWACSWSSSALHGNVSACFFANFISMTSYFHDFSGCCQQEYCVWHIICFPWIGNSGCYILIGI